MPDSELKVPEKPHAAKALDGAGRQTAPGSGGQPFAGVTANTALLGASGAGQGGSDPDLLGKIRRRQVSVPSQLSGSISGRLGVDLDRAKVFETPNLEASLGESAVTRGSEIYIQQGKYSPNTASGQSMLMHEMTHIAQQGLGLVSGSGPVSNPSLEAAANAGSLGGISTSGFSMPSSGAAAPMQGLGGFRRFINSFTEKGRERNRLADERERQHLEREQMIGAGVQPVTEFQRDALQQKWYLKQGETLHNLGAPEPVDGAAVDGAAAPGPVGDAAAVGAAAPAPEPAADAPPAGNQAGIPNDLRTGENEPGIAKIRKKISLLRTKGKFKLPGAFSFLNSSLFNSIEKAAERVNRVLSRKAGTGEEYGENCRNAFEAYEGLRSACEKYRNARRGAWTDEGVARYDIAGEILELATSDMSRLGERLTVPPENANIPMWQLIAEPARRETINLDDPVRRAGLTEHGANASLRLRFEHKGKYVFFTRESMGFDVLGLGGPDNPEEFEKFIDSMIEDIGDESKPFYKSILLDENINLFSNESGFGTEIHRKRGDRILDVPEYIRELFNKEPYNTMPGRIEFTDDEACKSLFDFVVGVRKARHGTAEALSNPSVTPGQSISGRNTAMSRVAELLGIGDVLARSSNAEIIQGRKRQSGNLMEEAKGEAPQSMMDNGAFAPGGVLATGGLDISAPKVQKQLVNLQLLDTLCGQVDRHLGNFFVQHKDGRATGITGIDNDMAFGKAGMRRGNGRGGLNDYFDKLPPFLGRTGEGAGKMALPVVDAAVAEKIIALSPEALKFALTGIVTAPDDQDALADRLEQMKAALRALKKDNPQAFIREQGWGSATAEALLQPTAEERAAPSANKMNQQNYYRRLHYHTRPEMGAPKPYEGGADFEAWQAAIKQRREAEERERQERQLLREQARMSIRQNREGD